MSTHAALRCRKICTGLSMSRCTKTAVIILCRHDIAAIGKASRLLDGLTKRYIRTHPFGATLLIIIANKLFYGTIELRIWILFKNIPYHLLFCCFRRPKNRRTRANIHGLQLFCLRCCRNIIGIHSRDQCCRCRRIRTSGRRQETQQSTGQKQASFSLDFLHG